MFFFVFVLKIAHVYFALILQKMFPTCVQSVQLRAQKTGRGRGGGKTKNLTTSGRGATATPPSRKDISNKVSQLL
jgi:hypothetical protein